MKLFSRTGAADIEAELRSFEHRHELLQGRLGSAVAEAQAARKVALDNLVDGDVDDTETQRRLEDAARDAQRAADSLAVGLGELDERIGAARQRLTTARDTEVRVRRAAELEAAAGAIAKRARELERATDALAQAFSNFVDIVPEDLGVERSRLFPEDQRTPTTASPADLARAIVAGGLFIAEPRLFEIVPTAQSLSPAHVARALVLYHIDDGADGRMEHRLWGRAGENIDLSTVNATAERVICDRLRKVAADLRAEGGERGAGAA